MTRSNSVETDLTISTSGNMSGNDVHALYESEVLYSSSYFGGSDPLTNSEGLTPIFLAPIEKYDGSSTPFEVVTSITVRYVDWVVTFALNSDSGSSITVNVGVCP